MKIAAKILLLLLVACAAAALRLPDLDARPMHADESVQAVRFRDLWQKGRYVYDPNEYHGPTLTYATLPSPALSGAEDFAGTTAVNYRIVTAFFGIGVVVLLFLFADSLGIATVLLAAVLAAASPAMVFYSRYYIHETLLVFFTLSAILCGWRYTISHKLIWCLLAGVSIGLMQATKETAAISYLAAGLAALLAWLNGFLVPTAQTGTPEKVSGGTWSWWHLALGALAAVFVAAAFLSSFLSNLHGAVDGVLTYLPWLSRAGGESPHVYPWSFYLHRLVWWRVGQGPIWSEGFIVLLAAVGFVRAILIQRRMEPNGEIKLMRWLAWYTFAMTAIYCSIPYKTPWCMLQFLVGLVLLAGYGSAGLLQWFHAVPARAIIAALLVVGVGHLGWQAHRASFVLPADVGNPYVFAHTSPDVTRLANHLDGLRETSSLGPKTPVKVIWTDAYYWPLPWYLRRFNSENVELWRSYPKDPVAPVVISAVEYGAELEEALGRDYIMVVHELRPQVLLQLWVEYDLWEAYLKRTGQLD